MSRPKYLYEIEPHELILHTNNDGAITIQQGDLLGRQGANDSRIHLDRVDAAKVRDALDQWLKETE